MASEEEAVEKLVQFASATRYHEIPGDVLTFAKAMIMKAVAGIVVGTTRPSGRKMTSVVRSLNLPARVGVIASGFRTSLWEAVFLNGFLAHAAEMADDYVVVPLLLSLAQERTMAGRALLEASAVGLEIHWRTSIFQSKPMGVAFLAGPVAPALAAGKILGLDRAQMTSALALATPNIGGTYLNMGTDAHYFESAHFTLQAILAAEMAEAGMTGNPRLLTFVSQLIGRENVLAEKLTEGLGDSWRMREQWIKKYPCCFQIHRYVDALLELKRERGLSPGDTEAVVADIGPSEAFCDRAEPATETDLQFSLQNGLAAALLDGDLALSRVDVVALRDAQLEETRRKVKIVVHPEWPSEEVGVPRTVPARITVRKKGGEELVRERLNPIGSWPESPLAIWEVRQLYVKFCRGILDDETIEKTADQLADLENLPDVKGLIDELVFGQR